MDGTNEELVAATRPESMLDDTAVAVYPDDRQYIHLIGKELSHPVVQHKLLVIVDGILVDPSFGAGAAKVTLAHGLCGFSFG